MATKLRSSASSGSSALSIPPGEYRSRRAAVLAGLKSSVGVVFAGDGSAPLVGKWRAHPHFVYLTGITNEPGAAVLFNPGAEDPAKRCILFLKPRDPEIERWDGYREAISASLRERLGFTKVFRTTHLARELTTAARIGKKVACLHPFASYEGSVSPDLTVFRKITERVPGVAIEDQTNLIPMLRSIKSKAELAMMTRAAEITRAGYAAAAKVIAPGVSETQVQLALEDAYRAGGATGPAYNSIVGAGLNSTVLHYNDNTAPAREGELLLIDSGAEYGGYACDVTRTYPVSGKFTSDQRKVYEVVLRAQIAAIRASKPGALFWQVDKAARDVIEKAGYGDAYIHGIGHHLGLEVHDATPDGGLKPGMVITIEPGIYVPETKTGVRIEDDVVITGSGCRVLTEGIAKEVGELERGMR